jgi:hypothetical protein
VPNPLAIDPVVSYKLAAPGHDLGSLTSDTPNAVVGQLGTLPSTIPITVTARDLDTGHVQRSRTNVVDETDVGQPTGAPAIEMIAPLAVAQAAGNIFDGTPGRESGSICVRIALRESPKASPRFCERYVISGSLSAGSSSLATAMASDISGALGLVDGVSFRALHITKVVVSVRVERGLAQADLVDAAAPRVVRRGRGARVRLLVRVQQGPLLHRSFTMRIPRSLRPGLSLVTLQGTPIDPSDGGSGGTSSSLVQAIANSLGGGGSILGPSIKSIPELIDAVKATSRYDGVKATFSSLGAHGSSPEPPPGGLARLFAHTSATGGHRIEAFRDPTLRIGGSATMLVRVAR